MKIIKSSNQKPEKIINEALEVLNNGGLVVFPTDTVYGLLADATSPKAVGKLLAFKGRPTGKAISVFASGEKMAEEYVTINQNAKNIINNLLPGPFTVICQSRHQTDPRLEAENGTLGFRIPDYPLINKLLTAYGLPLTATSANISSTPPHYSTESLLKNLSENKKGLLSLIVDAGKLPKNKPSTVIDTTSGQLITLRLGDFLPVTSNSLISKSEKQTLDLAGFILSKIINKSTGKPLVFLLQGDLGAGKTIFTKGLAKALGIKETVVSPTYTICYEYKVISTKFPQLSTDYPIIQRLSSDTERQDRNIKSLVHYDLYRLESSEELKEISFLESIKPGNIYAIEWPEKIDEQTLSKLKETAQVIYVKINHLSKNQREISWSN